MVCAAAAEAPASRVKELKTDQEYHSVLQDAAKNGALSVFDFTAAWCGPCESSFLPSPGGSQSPYRLGMLVVMPLLPFLSHNCACGRLLRKACRITPMMLKNIHINDFHGERHLPCCRQDDRAGGGPAQP